MIEKSPAFKQLLKSLQQVPYLASKNLYRVTAYFLSLDNQKAQQFCHAIMQAKNCINQCPVCCAWKEKDQPCFFCKSPKRNQHIICVVETWHEMMAIEKTGGYDGLYHILGGTICPLDGIGPEDLTINRLINRIDENIHELILATNQTPEGEATAAYIAHQIRDKIVTITCLARGVPVGSSLEYMDRVTVYKALSERRPF
jgi:recombination protein RecR